MSGNVCLLEQFIRDGVVFVLEERFFRQTGDSAHFIDRLGANLPNRATVLVANVCDLLVGEMSQQR